MYGWNYKALDTRLISDLYRAKLTKKDDELGDEVTLENRYNLVPCASFCGNRNKIDRNKKVLQRAKAGLEKELNMIDVCPSYKVLKSIQSFYRALGP